MFYRSELSLLSFQVSAFPPLIQERINIIQFRMHKPAHLPFHLLAWGQTYLRHYNCYHFYDQSKGFSDDYKGFPVGTIDSSKLETEKAEEYQICLSHGVAPPRGSPIEVLFSWKNETAVNLFNPANRSVASFTPIKYVYYTECDQIVKYDDMTTFRALTTATNESTFFTGRRKEKHRDSEPSLYLNDLNNWRECGTTGYSIRWPKSGFVYHDN
jgi:hypothetical protein